MLLTAALVLPGGALAFPYQSTSRHYEVEIPNGWGQYTFSSTEFQPDIAYRSPATSSNIGLIMLISSSDPGAKNASDYVLAKARREVADLGSSINITSQPHWVTIANRPAGDATIEGFFGGITLDMRFVIFSSEYYDISYMIVLAGTSTSFPALSGTWDSVLNSFRITGEKPAAVSPLANLLPLILGAVVVAAVVVLAVAMVVNGRRKKSRLTTFYPPAYQPQAQMVDITSPFYAQPSSPPPTQEPQVGVPPPPDDLEQH